MDYDQINDALTRSAVDMDAAEVHGILSGLLCAEDDNARQKWLSHCVPEVVPGDLLAQETLTLLEDVFSETQMQLQSSEFLYYPILPDEDSSLSARLEALSLWCQGFLLGISIGGIVETGKLPGDLPGFVNDLVEFSRLENVELDDEAPGGEQDEEDYMELVEYIRMGVLLFHEEIRALKAKTDSNTVH